MPCPAVPRPRTAAGKIVKSLRGRNGWAALPRERQCPVFPVMREDLERWESKYREMSPGQESTPDPLLIEHRHLLTGGGRACDLACGVGLNGIFLAQLGYDTCLIDGSFTALTVAGRIAAAAGATVMPVVADLDRFALPVSAFDAMVVIRYLNRSISGNICTALRPGGILIFKTFNENFLSEKPGFPKAYVLAPGEARTLFAQLECLSSNDDPANREVSSYLVGRKSAA